MTFNVIKVPNRNDKQCKTVKARVRLLYDQVLLKHSGCILMDDETYVYSDTAQLKVKGYYYAKKRLEVDNKYKFQCLTEVPNLARNMQLRIEVGCVCNQWYNKRRAVPRGVHEKEAFATHQEASSPSSLLARLGHGSLLQESPGVV